jgi:hypothetical protein
MNATLLRSQSHSNVKQHLSAELCVLAACNARVMHRSWPSRIKGAGNAGCWPQPMARQQLEKLAAVTTGSAKSSGIPCATVLTLMARSPRGPGLIAPVIARLVTARLGLSVGRPGPHAFASASAPFVRTRHSRAPPMRPSHPAPNVRDDREAPLLIEHGTARIMLPISGKVKLIFDNQHYATAASCHDGQSSHGPHARTVRRASSECRRCRSPTGSSRGLSLEKPVGGLCHRDERAADAVDQCQRIVRRPIAAPGDVLIRS